MVPQKRRRSSLAELREQENQRQAEIFGKNLAEPNHKKSVDDGHAASYLNPNPHPLYVPRSSQIFPTDHRQNFNFTMQVANNNCPATTGYTAIPLSSSHPCYGTPDNANTHHPVPSLWQTRSQQRTYPSVYPVGDRHYPEDFGNASIYPCYDQPCVQTNYGHMIGPSHSSISSERNQLSHSTPQSISQLQVTGFTSPNANFRSQQQEQPPQNTLVQCPRQLPLPCTRTAVHQGTSKRARKFWRELRASSGIVFASQLQPGQSPSKPIELTKLRRAGRVRDISCPLCGALSQRHTTYRATSLFVFEEMGIQMACFGTKRYRSGGGGMANVTQSELTDSTKS